MLCRVQNPKMIGFFRVPHNLTINIAPLCMCLPVTASGSQVILFIKQAPKSNEPNLPRQKPTLNRWLVVYCYAAAYIFCLALTNRWKMVRIGSAGRC